MSKHLIFLGAPGSGKGTQSAKLKGEGYKHVSTGELLRSEVAKKSDLGLKITQIMESGNLVSDEVVVELLKANLNLKEEVYIFDGYPRNLEQAKTLNTILDGHDYQAVIFGLNTDKLVERLTNRRTSPDGKHIYNLITNPPKVAGICDVTGDKLNHREDDREDVVRNRMEVFGSTIGPVIDFYANKNLLIEIDANRSVEEIYVDLLNKID